MKSKLPVLIILIIIAVGLLISYFTPKVVSGSPKFNGYIELESIHHRLGEPSPREWRSVTNEKRQTFEQYSNNHPNGKTKHRNKIYIKPIGSFSSTEKKVLELVSEYLENFYDTRVEILDSVAIELIPDTFIRIHQDRRQASASYILNDFLAPHVPEDAVACVALSKIDLYKEEGNNFVFGLGNLTNRSGVYSTARFGNPDTSDLEYKLFVSRTLKVVSHELGHIFGMKHCIDFRCIMNGSNSLTESDSKPVYLCPADLKKICWNLKIKETQRFMKLKEFWTKAGFEKNSNFYNKSEIIFKANVSE